MKDKQFFSNFLKQTITLVSFDLSWLSLDITPLCLCP